MQATAPSLRAELVNKPALCSCPWKLVPADMKAPGKYPRMDWAQYRNASYKNHINWFAKYTEVPNGRPY
ncbi:MAG: hypothetical protein JWQ23_1566 [Herminiimonas sp.]|nr:hypothetical protein [Herminiimonas sp.]